MQTRVKRRRKSVILPAGLAHTFSHYSLRERCIPLTPLISNYKSETSRWALASNHPHGRPLSSSELIFRSFLSSTITRAVATLTFLPARPPPRLLLLPNHPWDGSSFRRFCTGFAFSPSLSSLFFFVDFLQRGFAAAAVAPFLFPAPPIEP